MAAVSSVTWQDFVAMTSRENPLLRLFLRRWSAKTRRPPILATWLVEGLMKPLHGALLESGIPRVSMV